MQQNYVYEEPSLQQNEGPRNVSRCYRAAPSKVGRDIQDLRQPTILHSLATAESPYFLGYMSIEFSLDTLDPISHYTAMDPLTLLGSLVL